MNYYQHHIGDFDKSTRHLTRTERSIYRDLIELYYDIEQPLPLDIKLLCRRIIATTNEEATAVEQTLNEFFTKTPTGWYHDRCEEEIEKFRSSTSQKAHAGRASAAKRAEKRQHALNERSTSVEQTFNGTPTNQEPITNNQEPNKEKQRDRRAYTTQKPDAVSQQTWDDWMKLRKAKHAPVTDTVVAAAIDEAQKASMPLEEFLRIWCMRGSQGLQADWLRDSELKSTKPINGHPPPRRMPEPESFEAKDYGTGIRPL